MFENADNCLPFYLEKLSAILFGKMSHSVDGGLKNRVKVKLAQEKSSFTVEADMIDFKYLINFNIYFSDTAHRLIP